jgi:DNA invertase Pin-like site-specific DNA recombinase
MCGYARISTEGQSEAAAKLCPVGLGSARDFPQHFPGSGAKLAHLVAQLDAGDVLMVTRLDRPGPFDPRPVEHARGDPRSESRFPLGRRRMGRHDDPERRLTLTALEGVAEFGRELIRACTSERRRPRQGKRAMSRPQAQAHPPTSSEKRSSGAAAASHQAASRSYNVGPSAISRLST